MKTIDTKGYTCPRPLIMLKEGLTGMKSGEEVTVITDNETSLSNLVNYRLDARLEELEKWIQSTGSEIEIPGINRN